MQKQTTLIGEDARVKLHTDYLERYCVKFQSTKENERHLSNKVKQSIVDNALKNPHDHVKMLQALMTIEERQPVFKDSMTLIEATLESLGEQKQTAFVFKIQTTTTCDLPGLRDIRSAVITNHLAADDYI